MCGIVFAARPLKAPGSHVRAHHPSGAIPSGTQDSNLDQADSTAEEVWASLTAAVADRGPNYSNSLVYQTETHELRFHTSVLHLRGERVTQQPFQDEKTGNVLCWNGEIFDSLPVEMNENDGLKLFHLIQTVGFFEALHQIQGSPYSLIYYDASRAKVYFTRDVLGRRSLLKKERGGSNPFWVLTSTAPAEMEGEWEEVSAEGIYELDLDVLSEEKGWEEAVKVHERCYRSDAKEGTLEALIYPFDRLNRSLPSIGSLHAMTRSFPPLPVLSQPYIAKMHTFIDLLTESIRQRVLTIPFPTKSSKATSKPRIAVLFSGGLDCTVVARLVDKVLPEGEGIDLINVAFENPRKLDASAAGPRKGKKKETKKDRQDKARLEKMLEEGLEIKEGEREEGQERSISEEGETLAPPTSGEESSTPTSIYDVPDRLTGLSSWRELCELSPGREWNFVKVDVPYSEMLEHRQKVIDLMKPQDTVMDLSIAIAFYFASRARGTLAQHSFTPAPSDDPLQPYHSTARVLLSGLGADELLGGYARHRKAYNQYQPPNVTPPLPDSPKGHEKWTLLIDELQMDLSRLSTRNLGRDDRIVSSNSKEVRYPFLSIPFVSWVVELKVWEKCDMRFEEGLGDKLMLRLAARELGLIATWREKKRAIHFGARTAKMEKETGKAKGTDRL